MNQSLKQWILVALFSSISFVLSTFIFFPNMAPFQHMINVIAAMFLSPFYAFLQALLTGIMRMMTGRSINSIIGAIFGALLSSVFYHRTNKVTYAIIGEVLGTGFISAYVAYLVMKYFFNTDIAHFYYFIPFFLPSSLMGSLLGAIIGSKLKKMI